MKSKKKNMEIKAIIYNNNELSAPQMNMKDENKIYFSSYSFQNNSFN